MTTHAKQLIKCELTGKMLPAKDMVPAVAIRPAIAELIRQEHPEWCGEGFISREELNRYRIRYVEDALEKDKGELSTLESQVVESLGTQELVSEDVNKELDEIRSFGERLSDHITSFGGSWAFIISFSLYILIWMGINIWPVLGAFDPYPYILLNLTLSCLAAVQAPIILMSQKRQEAKDRLRAEHDYQVNLKAELEIRHLHEKLDHLLIHQWQRLLEIQHMQTELMEEMNRGRKGTR